MGKTLMEKNAASLAGFFALAVTLLGGPLAAHDIWVEPSSAHLPEVGAYLYLDVKLGNHGNDHRDFKLWGKLSPPLLGLSVALVSGLESEEMDLTEKLVDLGSSPREGYWSALHRPETGGLYRVTHRMGAVMTYAPVRSTQIAKTYFAVGSLEEAAPWTESVLGEGLELVPLSHPVLGSRVGSEIAVRVLFKGQPVAGKRVSFLGRGSLPEGEFDPSRERLTDAEGVVRFTLIEPGLTLIVAHHFAADESGEGYDNSKYGATLILHAQFAD